MTTAADSVFDACLAVPPVGSGTCDICCGALGGVRRRCWSCRRVEAMLGRPLRPVVPISLSTRMTALYAAIRRYKGRPGKAASRQQLRLALLVEEFLSYHSQCVAPRGFGVVTVVPSTQVSEKAHPWASTIEMVPALGDKLSQALVSRSEPEGEALPDAGAYVCRPEAVANRRVLLVDDLYTTGAHIQSAAAALEDAGAASVDLLVVARHQDLDWPPARGLVRWSSLPENTWWVGSCIRCAPTGGPARSRAARLGPGGLDVSDSAAESRGGARLAEVASDGGCSSRSPSEGGRDDDRCR